MSYSKPKGSGVYDFDEVTEEEAHQMAAAEVRSAAQNGTTEPATVSWRAARSILGAPRDARACFVILIPR